ncbi:hypothetical protein E4U60_006575 [Claviceps pazoutovae]|uniref:Uncharacterized protein n=1 Tax=Claviceps pazoutovae TaxID=1649127 RepID=A0A9P7M6P9_9HYPO|nr:hypothetical protein E4U60_006575 [Claviceps pazoutovae]
MDEIRDGSETMAMKFGPETRMANACHASGSVVFASRTALIVLKRMARPTLETSNTIFGNNTKFITRIRQRLGDLKLQRESVLGVTQASAATFIVVGNFQRLIVQWLTDANLPFYLSEHRRLRKIFAYLNPLVDEQSANIMNRLFGE